MRCILFLIIVATQVGWSQANIDLTRAEEIYERGKELYYEGKYGPAINTLDSSRTILEKQESITKLHVRVVHRMASTLRRFRKYEEAEKYFLEAAELAKDVYGENSDRLTGILSDLGLVNESLGRYTKAMDYFHQAMAMEKVRKDKGSDRTSLWRMNKAGLLLSMGSYSKTISELHGVLEEFENTLDPDHENYNRVYLAMGNAYRKIGDVDKAMLYAKKALEIKLMNYREAHPSVSKYLMSYAKAMVEVGRLEDAKFYFQRARENEIANKDRGGLGSLINDAARIYQENGRFRKALDEFQLARQVVSEVGEETYNIDYNIAHMLYELDQHEEAYELMKEISSARPDAQNQLRLSKWARSLGHYDEARAFAKTGAGLVDGDEMKSIDYLVNESKLLRVNDLEKAWVKVNDAVEQLILTRRSFSGEASKAYINKELEAIFYYAVELGLERYEQDPASAELFEDLYLTVEQAKAASFWDNDSEDNASYFGGVPAEFLEDLEVLKAAGPAKAVELKRGMDRLASEYPKYFQYKYSLDFPSLDDVQAELSSDMVVMDYFVLDNEVVNLIISAGSHKVLRYDRQDFTFSEEVAYLDDGVERVTVIPHDFIHRVAFDGLRHSETARFLLYDYAFSYQVNVRGLMDSNKSNNALEEYLGLVPEWGDMETSRNVNRDELVPLPGAYDEVMEVSKLFGGRVLRNEEATEGNFMDLASRYEVVHFATHASVDPDNELNSILYLHPDDEKGDGRLEMDEIMAAELNSELVILSACETGAGGFKSGEGVMSMARAFQYAGAESVMMSLWRANDQSAHPIVLNFLKNYKAGMTKDVALQQSKITYLSTADPLLRDEFYWAGFVVSGNLSAVSRWSYFWWICAGAVILLLLFAAVRFA